MQCPIDGTQLVMTDRSGVEIDYCPQCRGVWLDRGELDKIIERSAAINEHMPLASQTPEHSGKKKKRKKNGFADLLDDIFDF